MELRERVTSFVRNLPVAHRVGIVAAMVVLVVVLVAFLSWVTQPSYTVLYSGLAEQDIAATIDELEALGVPYEIEGGGDRILVPRGELYETRASLAQAGIAGSTQVEGYEILEEQGLAVSDFRQRVDYVRALEGELKRTLAAMNGIDSAQVHLVLPEDELFTERQKPTTASVLLDTTRPLEPTEVEAVAFLVSSSVEGLEPNQLTIADADGTVLHAPGDAAGAGGIASRQLRQTREFESALASDTTALLQRATGSPASVVVRANLNFDESQTETETYAPDSQVAIKEQLSNEEYEGVGALPGGTVGVDGGPLPDVGEESTYNREDATTEYGVDRTTTTTIEAPGAVEKLSVAIVMDDGSLTGAAVPPTAEVEELVGAALGLDAARGDSIAVSRVAFPQEEDEAAEGEEPMLSMVPQLAGALVLVLVAVALFLMTRRRGKKSAELEPVAASPTTPEVDARAQFLDALPASEPEPEDAETRQQAQLREDVAQLVSSQPEEIATVLRGWLADRRGA